MSELTMEAKDAVAGSLGKCYVTIPDKKDPTKKNRYLFMQATKVDAKFDKTKTEVPIMGKISKGNKSSGGKGTGSATFHYNTSIFRELLEEYQNTGKDIYFDMEVYNNDPGSDAGQQVTILYGCNLDGGTVAKLDANSQVMEEDVNFTFEKFKIKKKFANLPGMVG